MISRFRRRTVSTIAAAVLVASVLAGCSAASNSATAGSSDEAESISRSIEAQTGEAFVFADNQGIPEGFPEAVPLVDGAVAGTTTTVEGRDAWIVSVEVENKLNEAISKLENAGFDLVTDQSADGEGFVGLGNDDYLVGIMGTAGAVVYSVSSMS